MRRMGMLLHVIVWLACVCPAAPAQDRGIPAEPPEPEPVMIRSSLDPDTPALVGQKVRLYIDVMTNTWFTKAPQYPELRIPHAVCLELSQFGTNYSERIQGETYAVQRKEYVIYPQREARYAVPALAVEITYARPGDSPGNVTLKTPDFSFDSRIPEQARGVDHFVCTPRFLVREQYDRGFEDIKVGDSVTRTITMTAEDSAGMMLPPLEFSPVEGIAVYPKAPRTENASNRGENTGIRVESTTYVMEAEGTYVLPAIQLFWYDLGARDLRVETLEAVQFSVAANPDLDAEMPAFLEDEETGPQEEAEAAGEQQISLRNILYLALAILGVTAALGMFVFPAMKRLRVWRKRQRELKAESEEAFFRDFRNACRSRDPHRIMQSLLSWLDRGYSGPGAATVDEFVSLADDMELRALAAALKDRLYRQREDEEPPITWHAADFYHAVARTRKRLIRKRRAQAPGLDPLNP